MIDNPSPAPASDACLIIPMYNEAGAIEGVVQEASAWFSHVICVDDGSSDCSAAIAGSAGAVVIRHASNLGQGAALQTGITFALANTRARWLVTFDADGQHRLEDALKMLCRARISDADVILGSRFLNANSTTTMPRTRRAILSAAVLFTRATTRLPLTDTHNGLRVFTRSAAERMHIRLHGMAHASEILSQIARLGLRYEEFPVAIRYTDYSARKGQRGINALNILFDVFIGKIRNAA